MQIKNINTLKINEASNNIIYTYVDAVYYIYNTKVHNHHTLYTIIYHRIVYVF